MSVIDQKPQHSPNLPSAGAILRFRRTEAKLTATDLGKKVGVTKAMVSMIEHGTAAPSLKTAHQILSTLPFTAHERWVLAMSWGSKTIAETGAWTALAFEKK